MDDYMKRTIEQSPKASPLGNRSPHHMGGMARHDSTGTLKTTISLMHGRTPAIVQKGPFYLCKELPEPSEVTGAVNLIEHHGLKNAYTKYCGKKMKEELSSELSLPGNINLASDDNSTLRSVVDKPPIGGKELVPLTSTQLAGFRLHPGQLPEQYRLFAPQKKKSKKRTRPEQEIKPGSVPAAAGPSTAEPSRKVKPKRDKDKPKKPKKEKRKKREKD